MVFPIRINSIVRTHSSNFSREITLHRGLTVILGPNGSGKTHLLRGVKESVKAHTNGKKVRFISAGRMGPLENYRSDYDGYRGGSIRYEEAVHGNKSNIGQRHLNETLDGDFQTLSQRTDIMIKVRERLRKLFKRDIFVEWDAGTLKIAFARIDSPTLVLPYSSGREASGLLHLVGILTALYDDEVGALLIDEPEVSLHPQLQSFLLKEIVSCAGLPENRKKLVVIATHSTEFIQIQKPEDLSSIVFCYDLNDTPIQIDPTAGELKNKGVRGLVARLGQEHKLALFSKRPLLVEGPSDVIIISGLATKLDSYLEAAGAQLLPVVGKDQLPIVAKLMQLMGKEPVLLADADAIADNVNLLTAFLGNNAEADAKANLLGASSASDLVRNVYNDFCQLVTNDWQAIRTIAERHYYWINRSGQAVVEQAKRRAALCALFQPDSDSWLREPEQKSWRAVRDRLNTVFDLAESAGLFILKQGTIESYYQKADRLASVGKPNAAADELDWIQDSSNSEIEQAYGDVMRCVRYAANTEDIQESEALRDILLSVAAPAQAKLHGVTSNQDLQLLSRSILGERSEIFELSLQGEALVLDLKSEILDVTGFPMEIKKDDNVGAIVAANLKSDS